MVYDNITIKYQKGDFRTSYGFEFDANPTECKVVVSLKRDIWTQSTNGELLKPPILESIVDELQRSGFFVAPENKNLGVGRILSVKASENGKVLINTQIINGHRDQVSAACERAVASMEGYLREKLSSFYSQIDCLGMTIR